MKTGTFIGIDFGTTNTAVVQIVSDDHGVKTGHLGESGEYPFSSIVAVPKNKNDEKLLFGHDVRKRRAELSETHEILLSMKSFLGTDKEFVIGDRRCSPIEITTAFLRHIKRYIAENHHIEVQKAAFAFPVDFSAEARRDLSEAAKIAEIEIIGFVNEATAAYVANRDFTKAYSKIMVIDWGGGTLDISILELKNKNTKVFESGVFGAKIGGDDIDIALARHLHAKLSAQKKSKINFDEMPPEAQDKMLTQCELVKIEFSASEDDYPIRLNDYGKMGTVTHTVSFEAFVSVVTPVIVSVLENIEIALSKAGTNREGIDAVIIVGGSSNLRPFQNVAVKIFGREKIIRPDNMQWSVAKGAALLGIIGGKHRLSDDLCVLMSDDSTYSIFNKERDGVGSKKSQLKFSLTEDSQSANFIFTDSGKKILDKLDVPTKGYYTEDLLLSAGIGEDQIAEIKIENKNMGKSNNSRSISINKLKFFYDLKDIGEDIPSEKPLEPTALPSKNLTCIQYTTMNMTTI